MEQWVSRLGFHSLHFNGGKRATSAQSFLWLAGSVPCPCFSTKLSKSYAPSRIMSEPMPGKCSYVVLVGPGRGEVVGERLVRFLPSVSKLLLVALPPGRKFMRLQHDMSAQLYAEGKTGWPGSIRAASSRFLPYRACLSKVEVHLQHSSNVATTSFTFEYDFYQ
jgi:hypothetical protein